MFFSHSLKNKLHNKVPVILQQTFNEYKRERGYHDQEDDEALLNKLRNEQIRLVPMVDQSILNERVQRTKKTFYITLGIGLTLAIFMSLFTGGLSLLTLLAPIVTASGAAYASMKTVGLSYKSRISGGFDSVVALHKNEIDKKNTDSQEKSGVRGLEHQKPLERSSYVDIYHSREPAALSVC